MKNLYVVALLFTIGCGSILQNRKEAQAVKSVDSISTDSGMNLVRESLATAPISIVGGNDSVINVDIPAVPQSVTLASDMRSTGASRNTQSLSDESRLPLSLALLFGSIAFAIITFLIILWRRSSLAARAVTSAADSGLASVVDQLGRMAARSTSSDHGAEIARLEAHVEKVRGKVKSK